MSTQPKPKKAAPKSAARAAPRKKAAPKAVKPPTIAERIAAFGQETIIDRLADGVSLSAIAQEIGVSAGKLCDWIASNPECSARAREARVHAARLWDEKAVTVIEDATDPFELARAKELAHHYRWRASKTAPREYGDKIEAVHTGPGGGAIQVESTVTFVRPPARVED